MLVLNYEGRGSSPLSDTVIGLEAMQNQISQLEQGVSFAIDIAKQLINNKKILILTGAGLSTDSGIPDYRGEGRVARHPMTYDTFMESFEARQRYWARSFVGWSRISLASPNNGHDCLAKAEKSGNILGIVTQNVDGLHTSAGSSKVIDLHGRLDRVICLGCQNLISRTEMDKLLELHNPGISKDANVEFTPDGDAEIQGTEDFKVPSCSACGGILKPDVVFFGENVPKQRVADSFELLEKADVLLVAGSSLTVNSGFRFARQAHKESKPIVIVNLGPTRADNLATVKIEANTSLALERLFFD